MSNADTGSKPFARGKTFYNGGTIDSSNLGGIALEGQIHTFDAEGAGRPVTCILVRNVGAAALLPKRLCVWQAGQQGKRVDGYTAVNGTYAAGFVDDQLPAAGVPVNDLFWLMVDGPGDVLTDIAGDALTNFSANDPLVAATAATSGATTAGRVVKADLTGATSVLANQILNSVGRAMSANTTAQTNRSLLLDINIRR